jgi:hypothetical protein
MAEHSQLSAVTDFGLLAASAPGVLREHAETDA